MRTRANMTLTAAGLVIRALDLAKLPNSPWTWITIHEHMRDALADLEVMS